MKNKFLRAISQYRMLDNGDTVVVAVSGGADSMALLHLMHSCREQLQIRIIAAHFHHGIRGAEADRDMACVNAYCNANGIEFVAHKADVPAIAEEMKLSLEECGRVLRYSFLQQISQEAKIATAHTNSDSCESFLFNYARGTGLQGLCGIPPVRNNIIRPLIFCSAQDTRTYCSDNNIPWCEDSSNKSKHYARNRIRLQTVPSLKSVNDHFEDNAMRCMQILQTENDYLQSVTETVFNECFVGNNCLDFAALRKEHKAIVTRVLLHFLRKCNCKDVSMRQIEMILNAVDGDVVTLNNATMFLLKDGLLCLNDAALLQPDICISIDNFDCRYAFYDSEVYVSLQDIKSLRGNEQFAVDAEKIGAAVLRNRRSGDKLRIARRNCTKTLKQLFNENKIDFKERYMWPVIADDKGVIWCRDFGVDESRLPDKNTKKIIIIEWRRSI